MHKYERDDSALSCMYLQVFLMKGVFLGNFRGKMFRVEFSWSMPNAHFLDSHFENS